MDTAKMSQNSDSSNSSDDLIAELARLMAADARGDAPAPAATPEQPKPTPAAPTRSPSERLEANYDADRLFNAADASRDRMSEGAHLKVAPTFRAPDSRAPIVNDNVEAQPQSEVPTPPRRNPVDLFAGMRQRGETPSVAETRNAPSARTESANDRFQQPPVAPAPTAQAPMDDDDGDPIGRLIAARLDEAGLGQRSQNYADDWSETPADNRATAGEENDSFATAPVFGLGNQPFAESAPQQRTASNPLDDIETLIGQAVRQEAPRSPQEPPLQPARSNRDMDFNGAAEAAEAAIMAATASAGEGRRQQVDQRSNERAEPQFQDEAPIAAPQNMAADTADYADHDDRPAASWKRFVGPLVAAGLLVAVGGGVYWMFGSQGESDGVVPVLSADTSPTKAAPDVSTTEAPTTESVVFSELNGESGPGNTEQLVSRDQSGTDVASASSDVSRVIDTASEEVGLVNRKVRTVTVRPDGTIVNGDDALAGGEVLPVERPNVPALPEGTNATASEFSGQPIVTDQAPTIVASASNTANAANDVVGQTINSLTSTADIPIPQPRPVDRAALAAANRSVVTTTAPATTSNNGAVDLFSGASTTTPTTPAATAVTSVPSAINSPAYVQLSSQRSEAAAQQTATDMQRRFGSLFGGAKLEVQQTDLQDRGTFYRVWLPANSLADANEVCNNIKLQGGDCFVRNN